MRISRNVIKYSVRNKLPLPPRFKTKFTMFGKLVLASGFTNANGAISANELTAPFNNTFMGMWSNVNPAFATNQPTAMTTLLNANCYENYRVYASSIKLKIPQIAALDCCEVLTIPVTDINLTASEFRKLAQQPYSKWITTTNARQNFVKNYMTTHKIYGTTARAVQDDVSTNFQGNLGQAPFKTWFWYVFVQSSDLQNTTNDIVLDVQIDYYVELWNLQTGLLVET